mgnify:CR=1 FL=1
MKLYTCIIKMIINKLVKRKNNGECIKLFCEEMGIAYIKLAQILAMQNYGNLFTETDRKSLSSICDFVKPILPTWLIHLISH